MITVGTVISVGTVVPLVLWWCWCCGFRWYCGLVGTVVSVGTVVALVIWYPLALTSFMVWI